jgi:uncharacterized protein YkwD
MDKIKYVKIIVAQAIGFFASYYLVTNVFIGPIPIVRSDVQDDIVHLPQKTVEVIKSAPEKVKNISAIFGKYQKSQQQQKQADAHIPPPWIFGEGPSPLPTSAPIIPTAQQAPTVQPEPTFIIRFPTSSQTQPTSSQTQPTSVPQIPTTVPTKAPQPTQTTSGGSGGQQSGNATLEQQTVDEINKRRRDVGLKDLTINAQLTQAARRHSADMSANNFCGHDGKDGSGPFQRTKDAGYTGQAYGETVSCWARTPMQAVDGWWSSPPHHAILTNGSIREIGLGWVNIHQTAVVGM